MRKLMLIFALVVLGFGFPAAAQTTPNTPEEVVERYVESTFSYVILSPGDSALLVYRAVFGPGADKVDLMKPLGMTPAEGQGFYEGTIPRRFGTGRLDAKRMIDMWHENFIKGRYRDSACVTPTQK